MRHVLVGESVVGSRVVRNHESERVTKVHGHNDRVRFCRLSDHRMSRCQCELHARVGKAGIGRGFQEERKRASNIVFDNRVRVSRESGKEYKDCGTSLGVLGCLTVRASWNSIFVRQARRALPSLLALSSDIVIPYSLDLFQCCIGTSSCVSISDSGFTRTNRNAYTWFESASFISLPTISPQTFLSSVLCGKYPTYSLDELEMGGKHPINGVRLFSSV